MTEFVIGLPVFIMIFGGILMLYDINNEILMLKAKANSDLWSKTNPGAPIAGVTPLTGGVASLIGSDDFADVAQNAGSIGGIYVDSYIKTKIPITVIPGAEPSPCADAGCALGGRGENSLSFILLNDNMAKGIGNAEGGSISNILSSVLSVTGSRPAFVAGIRYGAVQGESQSKTIGTPMFGDIDVETGNLDVPGVTAPTHRSLAVLVTRLEFAREEFWDVQVPEFDDDFRFGSPEEGGGGGECGTAVDAFEACKAAGPEGESDSAANSRCEDSNPGDACSALAEGDSGLPSIGGGWCTGAGC